MTDRQPELCDPETRVPSSHSCDLPDSHMGVHHCPACGAGWVFGSDCEPLEVDAEPSRTHSSSGDAPDPLPEGSAPPEGITEADVPGRWVTAFLAALNEQARQDRLITWTMPGTEEARALLAVAAQWLEQENAVSWGTDCTSCARLLDRSYADHARAEAAEGKLAETERQLEHAREAAAGSHEGIRLWMLDCSRIAGKHRERAEAAQAKLDALTPKPLTAAELARLDRTISEYGDAVTAVRRALELAGTCARTDEEGRVAVAAWEGLKVLSGEEGDDCG